MSRAWRRGVGTALREAADIEKAAAAADEGAATLALCEAKRGRRPFRRLPLWCEMQTLLFMCIRILRGLAVCRFVPRRLVFLAKKSALNGAVN